MSKFPPGMKLRRLDRQQTRPSAEGETPSPAWSKLFDIDMIEAVLQQAAQNGKALSYAEALNALGYDFSRPKMRALCVALGEVDARAQRRQQPALAVLVVRASDGIPGAGWWSEKDRRNYKGPQEGPEAMSYIKKKQKDAFRYWRADKKI